MPLPIEQIGSIPPTREVLGASQSALRGEILGPGVLTRARGGRARDDRQMPGHGRPLRADELHRRSPLFGARPSKQLLTQFIEFNNSWLDRFTPQERERIGVHTCPGGDQKSTYSLDVDYLYLGRRTRMASEKLGI